MGAAGQVSGAPLRSPTLLPRPAAGAVLRRRWVDPLLACLLGAAALALYLRSLAPGLLEGDAGELQLAPYLLGVPHPTGYPLYSLLGWAWSHLLPLGSVAYRMNLFSAFWAALAVALLYPTTRALLRQSIPGLSPLVERLAAVLAPALLAVTPTFWSQAVIAEVYSLNIFFFVLILYLLLSWGETRRLPLPPGEGRGEGRPPPLPPGEGRGEGRPPPLPSGEGRGEGRPPPLPSGEGRGEGLLLLAALAFGLSLAHHRTTVLLVPVILAYLLLVDHRILRRGRLLLGALALIVAPLLLYLYIPWRAPHTPYLHLTLAPGRELALYRDTLGGFLDYILGNAYGGSLDLGVDLAARLAMAGRFFVSDLGWPVLGLSLAGLAGLVASRRWRSLSLTGLAFLALAGFNLFYTIGDIVVLFIPAFLLAILWAAVGVAAACHLPARLWAPAAGLVRVLPALPAAALLALPLLQAAGRLDALDQSGATQAEAGWRALLAEPLPEGAVLVTDNRNEIMPLWYLQYVGDGAPLRPDLLGLFPLVTPAHPTLGHVLDLALSTGRPVYLIKEMPGLEVKVQLREEGTLRRVVGPAAGAEPAHRLGVPVGGVLTLAGYDLAPTAPRPGDALAVSLQWEATVEIDTVYHTYVHLLGPDGERVAQSDRQPGGVYYPTTLWRVGERLLDKHTLALPAGAPDGTYRLVAGLYRLNADGTFASLGDPVALGELQVGRGSVPAAHGRRLAAASAVGLGRQPCYRFAISTGSTGSASGNLKTRE